MVKYPCRGRMKCLTSAGEGNSCTGYPDWLNKRTMLSILFMPFVAIWSAVAQASAMPIQKLCALRSHQTQPPSILIASDNSSQAAAIKKNKMMQSRRIVVGNKGSDTLFHKEFISDGDCLLVNFQEKIALQVYEELDGQSRLRRKVAQSTFVPAVHFVHKNKSKQYGLIDTNILPQLTVATDHRELTTTELSNSVQNIPNDMFLIYIICPSDRNGLCDLTIKDNGAWLKDPETGETLNIKVLARSQRENNPAGKSQRTHVNSDTPQGIYFIWGAVTGGGHSAWHRLARIDLDAALPPINGQPYNIQSYLLSKIVPNQALDDYWLNEWPLAYSLGRMSLRLAPGSFEAQHENPTASFFGDRQYNPTEGCINTGDNHERLLRILVEAGVFSELEVFGRSEQSTSKQWHVSPKLGKAFVIIKDRD